LDELHADILTAIDPSGNVSMPIDMTVGEGGTAKGGEPRAGHR
jgi:hypothetical protein